MKNVKTNEKSPARIVIEARNSRTMPRPSTTQLVSLPIVFPTGNDQIQESEVNQKANVYPEELYRALDKRGDMPSIEALFAGDMTERSEFKEKFLASLDSGHDNEGTSGTSGDSTGHFKAQAYGNVFTVIITYLCIVAVYLTAFRVALATRESVASQQVAQAKARVETLQIFFKEKSHEINVKQIDVIV